MKISELIQLVEQLEPADVTLRREIEAEIFKALLGPDRGAWRTMLNPNEPTKYLSVTTSLDAARRLLKLAFPGWIYKVCECFVSDDAWVTPDYNHPEFGADLQRRFPDSMRDPVEWFGTDVDLRPPGQPATAWCISMLLAKKKIIEVEGLADV